MIIKAKCAKCGHSQPHLHIHRSQCVCMVCGQVRVIRGAAKREQDGKE